MCRYFPMAYMKYRKNIIYSAQASYKKVNNWPKNTPSLKPITCIKKYWGSPIKY